MVSTQQVSLREVLGRPPKPPRSDDRSVLVILAVLGLCLGAALWLPFAAYVG